MRCGCTVSHVDRRRTFVRQRSRAEQGAADRDTLHAAVPEPSSVFADHKCCSDGFTQHYIHDTTLEHVGLVRLYTPWYICLGLRIPNHEYFYVTCRKGADKTRGFER